MDLNAASIPSAGLASTLAWWHEAGVDTLVAEAPYAWLAPAPVKHAAATATPQAEPVPHTPVSTVLPDTLDGFLEWFAQSPDVPGNEPLSQRIMPAGDRHAALMVLIDMPEPEDAAAGHLLSGEAATLFDNMLSALKLDRTSIWFAPMAPARIAGGVIAPDVADRIADIARHHVRLVAPKKLWLLGRAASRALLGMDEASARGRLHSINHNGGKTDVIASVHPRVLLQTPKRKAEVWADMRKLIEE